MGKEGEKPGGQKLIPGYGMLAASSPGLACWDYHITPRACAKAGNNASCILFISSVVWAEPSEPAEPAEPAEPQGSLRYRPALCKGLFLPSGRVIEM